MLALAILGSALAMLGFGIAHADPKPGMWQKSVVVADGVTVRKILDNTDNENTVCYVASRSAKQGSIYIDGQVSVAISCQANQ